MTEKRSPGTSDPGAGPSPATAAPSPSEDEAPCLVCGLVFAQPLAPAVWKRDPLTGARVHETCLARLLVERGQAATRIAAGQPRETDTKPDRTLPRPNL